jgi:hypothetical protein
MNTYEPELVELEAALDELDPALAGVIIREDPAAADVTEEWFLALSWQTAARILLRHRAGGGTLGDLFAAGAVLELNNLPGHLLPKTMVAMALCAAANVPAAGVLAAARRRVVFLELARLRRQLSLLATVPPVALMAGFAGLRERLTRIEDLTGRDGAPRDTDAMLALYPTSRQRRRRGIPMTWSEDAPWPEHP